MRRVVYAAMLALGVGLATVPAASARATAAHAHVKVVKARAADLSSATVTPPPLPPGAYLPAPPPPGSPGPVSSTPLGQVQTNASAAGLQCYAPGLHFMNNANLLYVSEEQDDLGSMKYELRARTVYPGSWEGWNWCYDPSTAAWSIQSLASTFWTSTEIGFPGIIYAVLRARSSSIGPWERYGVYCLPGGNFAFWSKANGLYVAAELGYPLTDTYHYGMLRARTYNTPGPWESFYGFPGCE